MACGVDREATLDELLAEPSVIALMRRDGVDADSIRLLFAELRRARAARPTIEGSRLIALVAAGCRAAGPSFLV